MGERDERVRVHGKSGVWCCNHHGLAHPADLAYQPRLLLADTGMLHDSITDSSVEIPVGEWNGPQVRVDVLHPRELLRVPVRLLPSDRREPPLPRVKRLEEVVDRGPLIRRHPKVSHPRLRSGPALTHEQVEHLATYPTRK